MYFPGKPQLKGAWIDITLEEDQLYHRRSVAPSVVWSGVLERSVQKNLPVPEIPHWSTFLWAKYFCLWPPFSRQCGEVTPDWLQETNDICFILAA